MRSLAIVPLTVTLAVTAACESSGPDDVFDLDALPRLGAVEEVRIGSVDDPQAGFSRISGVDVDRDGRLYLFEGQTMEFRVYEADGTLLKRFSRRGQGPGEFDFPPLFGVWGDTVWTYDRRGGRITLFDRQGALLGTGRTEGIAIGLWSRGFGYVQPWDMRPDGTFSSYMGLVRASRDDPAAVVGGTAEILVPRVRFDVTGAVLDTVGWDPSPPPRMARPPAQETGRAPFVEVGGRPFMLPQPPSELPTWLPLHDGRIVLDVPHPTRPAGAFRVTRIALAGDTVYSRTYAYRADEYDSAELDSLAARAARGETGFGPSSAAPADPAAEARIRAAMEFPPYRPAIRYGTVDEDGRLWLVRDEPEGDTERWVLLDEAGRPAGALDVPAGRRLMWSRGDVFWAVDLDELDVPWLVRFRLEESDG